MGHQQPLVAISLVNLQQKCALKRPFEEMQKALLKGMAGKVSQAGARRGKQAKCKTLSGIQTGWSPAASTDLFSLRSGRKGGASRRRAEHRKGRDCRRPGLAMQPPVTQDNYQVWRHSGLCRGLGGRVGVKTNGLELQ